MKWYRSSEMMQKCLLVLFGCFVILPMGWIGICSFENPIPLEVTNAVNWIGRYVSPEQYKGVISENPEYWVSYWNTVFLTLPALVTALFFASMTAFGLTMVRKRVKDRILPVYALLSLLPSQVLLVPQLILLSRTGLTGSRLAVIAVACFSPWYVFFLHRLCVGISQDTYEAARVEGAGEWKIFLRIALPQMKLGLLVFAVVLSSHLWGMVEEPLVYMQDPMKYPMSVFFHEAQMQIPYAGVILFALPVILLLAGGIREIFVWEEK